MPARRQLLERALLGACALQCSLERFVSISAPVSAIGWALASLLLALHSPRLELSPLYCGLLLRAVSSSLLAPLLVLFSGVVSLLFPWPDFSQLHGPYRTIGCRSLRLGGVECRVFYPADHRNDALVPYAHHGRHLMKGLGVFTHLPAWLFHNMNNALLAAFADAPVASPLKADGWPVVLFSHGLSGSLELYSYINQELASNGNVVVVLNHCDGSACVCSPEPGRVEYYQQITPEVRDDVDGAGYRFRNGQLQQRVSEVRTVLDAVMDETKTDSVFQRCDLTNVSVAGHSFGAATALSAAHQDKRFKKMVLLDAWMEPLDDDVRDGLGARVPALHLMSEHFLNWHTNAQSTERHARGCTHVQSRLGWLRYSRHNNFSDIPVFSPTLNRLMKSAGKIDHFYALRIIGQLAAAFLADDFDTQAAKFLEVRTITRK